MPTLKPLNDHAKPLPDIAAKLRKHPFTWVKIARGDRSRLSVRAASWRRTDPAAFRGGLYEFKTKTTAEGRVVLLGRYIPHPSASR